MSVLAEMIKTLFGTMRYPEVAEMIMSKITASELAYVLDMLGIKDTSPTTTSSSTRPGRWIKHEALRLLDRARLLHPDYWPEP